MGVFHVFKIIPKVPNRAKHLIYKDGIFIMVVNDDQMTKCIFIKVYLLNNTMAWIILY